MPVLPLPTVIDEAGPIPGCVTVLLEQGPGEVGGAPNPAAVVVLDHQLIQRLEATLRAVPRTAPGLVLASSSQRVFVAGADLKAIDAWDDPTLTAYLALGSRVFGILAELPCLTVAAINGAALGGGLELAMHCDGLVACPASSGKPYAVGLPEAGLCLCPGWGGTNLLPARMNPTEAITRTMTGKPMTYDEAVSAGLFDALAGSAAELLDRCKAWLAQARAAGAPRRNGAPSRWIGTPSRKPAALGALLAAREAKPTTESAAAVLRAVEAGLERGWQAALETERHDLVRIRHTAPARAALQAFFEKSKK